MKLEINKVKIAVMVPPENADSLRKLICETGAGTIGNYTECSVSTKVIGTFKPNNEANPTKGTKNKLEKVNEIKLEVICNIENVKKVLEIIKKNHPYETPGIDIIPLMDENLFN
ncbi:divalent cation tolerance protein CutA [bacterium]|nr:divalent cation tolerance protein CutA [bacterium]